MTQQMRRELAAAARSGYWSEAEGRVAVVAWRESGESAEQFGARHGLPARRLRWWDRRLGSTASGSGSANTSVALVPIEVIQRDERDGTIEVDVGEFKVRVARGVDPDALRTVIEVLRGC